jgi:hypothetical protein
LAEWNDDLVGAGIYWIDRTDKVLGETYSYKFLVKDSSPVPNTTESSIGSAVAGIENDVTAPVFETLTGWSADDGEPFLNAATTPVTVEMLAATAVDAGGGSVWYKFYCNNDDSYDSPSWQQDDPFYSIDIALPNEDYYFQVEARDAEWNIVRSDCWCTDPIKNQYCPTLP